MSINDEYRTLEKLSTGIYKEKGSKFLAFAYPVYSEDEIKQILDNLRKEYYDARHHCYAWRLGPEGEPYRINDDGEPGGTAGKPIHGQLLSHNLSNILIVVIRYFGGVKLGVSGLIHAYRTAASDAIEQGRILSKTVNEVYQIQFDYLAMNEVMKVIKDHNLQVSNQQFDLACRLELSHRHSEIEFILSLFEKIESVRWEFLRKE